MHPNGRRIIPSFVGGKSRVAFGQTAFFFSAFSLFLFSFMTIVAFEKGISLQAQAYFNSKTIVRDY